MKQLLFILLLSPLFGIAQIVPVKDGKVFYEEIDSVHQTKQEIFNRSRIWVVNTFKDAKDIIQLDDKDNGELIANGAFDHRVALNGNSFPVVCKFTMQISCRDNKFRVRIFDIGEVLPRQQTPAPIENVLNRPDGEAKNNLLADIDSKFKLLLLQLRSSVAGPKKDDF